MTYFKEKRLNLPNINIFYFLLFGISKVFSAPKRGGGGVRLQSTALFPLQRKQDIKNILYFVPAMENPWDWPRVATK